MSQWKVIVRETKTGRCLLFILPPPRTLTHMHIQTACLHQHSELNLDTAPLCSFTSSLRTHTHTTTTCACSVSFSRITWSPVVICQFFCQGSKFALDLGNAIICLLASHNQKLSNGYSSKWSLWWESFCLLRPLNLNPSSNLNPNDTVPLDLHQVPHKSISIFYLFLHLRQFVLNINQIQYSALSTYSSSLRRWRTDAGLLNHIHQEVHVHAFM